MWGGDGKFVEQGGDVDWGIGGLVMSVTVEFHNVPLVSVIFRQLLMS